MNRNFILSGQFGIVGTLGSLGSRIPGTTTLHAWNDSNVIPMAVQAQRSGKKVVLIGYSLGANEVALICIYVPVVDLIVAYDPSRQSPLARNGVQVGMPSQELDGLKKH